jgi:hypothetical protein
MSIVVSHCLPKSLLASSSAGHHSDYAILPLPVNSQLTVDATLLYRYYGPANEPILNDMTSTITNLNVV